MSSWHYIEPVSTRIIAWTFLSTDSLISVKLLIIFQIKSPATRKICNLKDFMHLLQGTPKDIIEQYW